MLYFGPETLMPVGSAIVAGIGAILVFWHRIVGLVGGAIRRLFFRRGSGVADRAPKRTGPPREK
jgi:hypothetical protein